MSKMLPVLRESTNSPARATVSLEPGLLLPETRQARARLSVALVSMPVISSARPSIQLGLLKAIGESHGFPVQTFHLHLDFAHQIGRSKNEALANFGRAFVGDWLFAAAAFGSEALPPTSEFVQEHLAILSQLSKEREQISLEELFDLREKAVPIYLDRMSNSIDWGTYKVVGFSSTFQQNLASFALATRIKRKYPNTIILFGGANFEGEMGRELVRTVDCVDYAVLGEADQAFPEFLIALQEGRLLHTVPGVCGKTPAGATIPAVRPPLEHMDELPVPAYEEFFERSEQLGLIKPTPRRDVQLPFESARGCWWGAKHHCTFCGLNGSTMKFRAKSAACTRAQLSEMARRYRCFKFEAVDNILDMNYLQSFLPELAKDGVDFEFFYEVKSNLTRAQIRILRDGGVRHIQPGIESLSSPVLALMRKGVKGIQNINILRWCRYYGIRVGWNLLYGFPGESEQDYVEQIALLPRLAHLEPAGGAGRIWMERFSPLFTEREAFPASYVRPIAAYRHLYKREVDLSQIAYFFEYKLDKSLPDSVYRGLHEALDAWRQAWNLGDLPDPEPGAARVAPPPRPYLRYFHAPGFLQIEDTRTGEPGTYTFTDPLARLYIACSERPQTAQRLKESLALPWPVEEIDEALSEFCRLGLMVREASYVLSLAIPATAGR